MERFVIELFLRGFVLCLLTAIALGLLRRTAAAYRHLVCGMALILLPLLPWTPRLLPPLRLLPAQWSATSERTTAPLNGVGLSAGLPRKSALPASQSRSEGPILGPKSTTLLPPGNGTGAAGRTALQPASHRERSGQSYITVILLAAWGLGTSTLLIRLLVALFRLHRLQMESRPTTLGSVPIRVSDQVETPLTWGMRRSVILLPAALMVGDRAVCDSALRHEQAHIARGDWMWNLLAELVCALCWFQPGAWWLRSRMRLESERACDDRVLLSGVAGPDYAAHLLQIVRSACTSEVAPAMAQSHRMEERMRHILDAAKPRHAQKKWLAVSALFVLALLSLAALRVAARLPDNPMGSASRRSSSADLTASPGKTPPAGGVQAQGSPAAAIDNADLPIRLADVNWGKTVDGLQPGFLLTENGFPTNRRATLNSYVAYRVLVRNTTPQAREFVVQCWNQDALDIPYLIPNADVRRALDSPVVPNKFRATGTSSKAAGLLPAYVVNIGPGEAVVVPGEPGLFIGEADKQRFPRIEKFKEGMSWIVQPITIHSLTANEKTAAANTSKIRVTIVDRDGKSAQRSLPLVPARSGGKPLYAGMQLEVGTNWDRTLTGNSKSVAAMVFSPDSKSLVTGSADGTAMVWDAVTGRSLLALKGRTSAISSALYSPNGKFILTGCVDGAIHIWDAATGEKQRTLTSPGGSVCALDITSDGTKILGGYDKGTVKVWDAATSEALVTLAYDNRLLAAAISPNGKNIAAGYLDGTAKVWDLQTRQSRLSKKLSGSEGVTSAHFDTNGTFYTWDREEREGPEETHSGKVKTTVLTMWGVEDVEKGQFVMLSRISCPLPENAISHVVTYSTLAMVFGLSEGRVVLNNMHDGPVTVNAHEGPVAAVAISPDGALGATGGKRNGRGEVKIWDMQAHKPTK